MEIPDNPGLERVAGGSAAALTAAEFALRHADRCARLVLNLPAANLTGPDPVEFTAVQRIAVGRVLNSDDWFRAFATLAPQTLLRKLLATDPALPVRVFPEERQRCALTREGLMSISRKSDRLRSDAFRTEAPTQATFGNITRPTLILSCEDDLCGTADTTRSPCPGLAAVAKTSSPARSAAASARLRAAGA